MGSFLIFYAVLFQVSLTFILLFFTGRSRLTSITKGETRVKDIALGQSAWPARTTQLANAYNNQFQLPILFYAVVIFTHLFGQGDAAMVILAWGFVLSRAVQAWIFVTSNNVRQRFKAFVTGFGILVVMWGYLAINITFSGAG